MNFTYTYWVTSFGLYQSTPFWSKAGKLWKANFIFWVGTSVSSIKFFKVTKKQSLFTKKQSLCTMVVSTNAYRIIFSKKLSGKFIITIKLLILLIISSVSFCRFNKSGYSAIPSSSRSNHDFWIVLLETENTSAAFLKDHEFGTKVKIWSLVLLFEIFILSFIQSTR